MSMIFDCPNREECESMGVLVDSDCIEYCGLYQTHRVEQLEQVATNAIHLLEILEDDLGAEVTFTRDETHEKWSAKVFRDQLKELGVEL